MFHSCIGKEAAIALKNCHWASRRMAPKDGRRPILRLLAEHIVGPKGDVKQPVSELGAWKLAPANYEQLTQVTLA
jgi:hypothetical protein